MLYVALSGAKATMRRQATNNHNLANVNTNGFKADLDATVNLNARSNDLTQRAYVDVKQYGVNGASGELNFTGRDLDVALEGDGFIAVQAPDGSEVYTRQGNLRVSPSGLLETASGHPVVGNRGPIVISPYESLSIGADGTISIKPLETGNAGLATIDRMKLVEVDPKKLEKLPDGTLKPRPELIRETSFRLGDVPSGTIKTTEIKQESPELQASNNVSLINGALESSNVNVSEALVNMIDLSRLYEMQIKLIKRAEENDTKLTNMLTS
jgi:flagellar basal-body rod protein FlgF